VRFSTAIGVSVALHGVLAAGLAAYVKYVHRPVVVASLDLSSVELSFSDEEDETAAAAQHAPAPPPAEPPSPADRPEPPEKPVPLDDAEPLPPPDDAEPPRPEPEREKMETPPAPEPAAPAAAQQAPRQARVDAPPRPRRAIRPDYPKGSRQRGEQGDVVLEIRVGADGLVDGVSVVASSGYPELDDAAVRAAKAARFSPARAGRESVASAARLTLTFRLR
jgi:protein TonB